MDCDSQGGSADTELAASQQVKGEVHGAGNKDGMR